MLHYTSNYYRRFDPDIRAITPIDKLSIFKQRQQYYLLMSHVLTIPSECDVSCDGETLSVIFQVLQ